MYTVAIKNGVASLASALTGTQPLFVVVYIFVIFRWIDDRDLFNLKQADLDKEDLTWKMGIAILVIVGGTYLVHCGAVLPGNCSAT